MFFPDKDQAYREVHRVLAPAGHYLFSIWDAHRYNPFGRIVHEMMESSFPVDPPRFMSVPFSYRFDEIKESAIAAGFIDITAAVVRFDKKIPDVANFARALVYGSPVIDQVQARGGVDPEKIVSALTQEFRREFGGEPGHMPLQAIMFSVKKPS
jgi:SAM-dependent methyltransferase